MLTLKGKWVLITGSSRGIGYQAAIVMAKQGCNLILHSRNLEHTKKLEEEVKNLGVNAYSVQAELSIHEEVIAMLDEIESRGTIVDVVLNNAGVQVAYRNNCFETPIDDYISSMKTNLYAVMTICYRLLPKMIERGFGRIVNTTSGIKDDPQQAGYSASKAALDKVTVDLATKVQGTDVIISLTDPGWCRTDLGGPYAPNSVEDSVPGVVVGAFVNDKKSGRLFRASDFKGLILEDAVLKAEEI